MNVSRAKRSAKDHEKGRIGRLAGLDDFLSAFVYP